MLENLKVYPIETADAASYILAYVKRLNKYITTENGEPVDYLSDESLNKPHELLRVTIFPLTKFIITVDKHGVVNIKPDHPIEYNYTVMSRGELLASDEHTNYMDLPLELFTIKFYEKLIHELKDLSMESDASNDVLLHTELTQAISRYEVLLNVLIGLWKEMEVKKS